MSIREASREFALHRVTVRKMLGILGSADLPAADPAPAAPSKTLCLLSDLCRVASVISG